MAVGCGVQGLEDQLLALVVDHERPDLQEQAAHLVRQLNEYNITLQVRHRGEHSL